MGDFTFYLDFTDIATTSIYDNPTTVNMSSMDISTANGVYNVLESIVSILHVVL